MNFVVIGSGPAGVCAVEAIRAHLPDAPVTMVSKDPAPAGSPVMLTYWLTGKYVTRQLYFRDPSWAEKNGITFKAGAGVTALDPSAGQIVLDDKKRLSYDRLLIATGTSAIPLPISGSNARGVGFFRNHQDARAFAKGKAGLKQVAIIGAGFIGLKLACHLREIGLHVLLLEREPRLAARIFDDETSRRVESILVENGIEVYTGVEVSEILQQKGYVSGLRLTDDRRFDCQRIVQAVGVRPNIQFLNDSGIELQHGVIVNDRMETNLAGIYAAGDVTVTTDSITGAFINNATWPAATRQGAIAGTNMAGGSRRYLNNFPINALDLFGLRVMAAGYPLQRKASDGAVVIQSNKDGYRKIVTRSGLLAGFILVGDIQDAGNLLNALKSKKQLVNLSDGSVLPPGCRLPPNLGYHPGRSLF